MRHIRFDLYRICRLVLLLILAKSNENSIIWREANSFSLKPSTAKYHPNLVSTQTPWFSRQRRDGTSTCRGNHFALGDPNEEKGPEKHGAMPNHNTKNLPPIFFSGLMVASGAALGPFLDSFHSAFGVLEYNQPIQFILWGSKDYPALITTWWVPALFGLAGFIIGWLYILLDSRMMLESTRRSATPKAAGSAKLAPSVPRILIGIFLFTFQYWSSGALFHFGLPRSTILNIMSLMAAAGFVALDGTTSGFIVSTATAIGGPLIEVLLLSLSRAHMGVFDDYGYHYTDLGETGFFPLWIMPVYFLGGPAVGNLARGWWRLVTTASVDVSKEPKTAPAPGCRFCNDTRCVPCPNCDGVGTYVAMGDRTVICTSCRGRGFVICRGCFSHYDEDPNDIEAIRAVMGRRPD